MCYFMLIFNQLRGDIYPGDKTDVFRNPNKRCVKKDNENTIQELQETLNRSGKLEKESISNNLVTRDNKVDKKIIATLKLTVISN